MLVVEKKQQRTVRVFKIFRSQMKRYGKYVSFPKNTDPTKTYSWRYLTKFIDDFDTIGLDDGELPSVIEAVIQDAKKRGLLRCGISILNKVDLLAVCHNKFERDVNDENHSSRLIKQSHDFLLEQLNSERNNKPDMTMAQLLSYRAARRGYANITRWLQADKISIGYIAVSRSCRQALREMEQHERSLFPSIRDLLSIRLRLQCRKSVLQGLREVLGEDLFEG